MQNVLSAAINRLRRRSPQRLTDSALFLFAALLGVLAAALNAALTAWLGRQADEVIEGAFLFVILLAVAWGWRAWRADRAEHHLLAQLHALAPRINAPFELNEVLQAVIAAVVDALGVDHGELALLSDDAQWLTVVAEQRGPDAEPALGWRIPCGADTPLASLVRDQCALVAPDVAREPHLSAFLAEILTRRQSRAFLAIPLVVNARTIGAIALHVSRAPRAFAADQVALAESLAAVAATAIEKARLLESERRRAAQLAVVNAVAQHLVGKNHADEVARFVARTIAQQFGWNVNASVFLLDAAQNDLVMQAAEYGGWAHQHAGEFRLKVGEGIVGWVAQNNQPLLVGDVLRDPRYVSGGAPSRTRSELAVPIRAGGLLLGVLNVESERAHAFGGDDVVVFQDIADDAGAALLNARLTAQVRDALIAQTKLLDASATITAQLEVDAVLENIVTSTREAVGADHCNVMLIDAQGYCYRWLGVGYDQPLEPHPVRAAGVSMRVMRSGQAVFLDDVAQSAEVNPGMRAEGIRSSACLPLRGKSDMFGVMWINFFAPHRFAPDEQTVLQTFANHAAVAIEQARLFEDVQRRLKELEAVNRISVALRAAQTLDEMLPLLLDETLAMVGTDLGGIWLLDAARGELQQVARRGIPEIHRAIKPGDEIVGQVLATGVPHVSRDLKTDPRVRPEMRAQVDAGMGGATVPIRAGQAVIGALAVAARRELTPNQVRLLSTVAEMAGVAIHRTRLHEETERRLRHITALREIDRAISSSLNLRVALEVVLSQVVAQLRVDAASVLLLDPHTLTLEYAAGRGFHAKYIERSRVHLGEGHVGRAALERRVVRIADLREDTDAMARAQWLAGEGFIAYVAAPLIVKGQVKGVLEVFHRAPFTPDEEWLGFLEALATQAAIAIDNAELFENLQRANSELAVAYDATIEGWSRALDLRDKETEGHTQRVTELTLRLARALGIGEAQLAHIRRGALLHDIGKMSIPDTILLKPGALTRSEWDVMRQHPQTAYEMLSNAFADRLPAPRARRPVLPSRKMGRHGLSARAERRSDPAGGAALCGGGRVGRADE